MMPMQLCLLPLLLSLGGEGWGEEAFTTDPWAPVESLLSHTAHMWRDNPTRLRCLSPSAPISKRIEPTATCRVSWLFASNPAASDSVQRSTRCRPTVLTILVVVDSEGVPG